LRREATALIAIALLAATTRAQAGSTPSVPRAAKSSAERVIREIARTAHGEAYPERYTWAAGDLNGDDQTDAIVLFTVEVGNDYTVFLMVLLANADGGYEVVGPEWAGARGKRFVSFDSLDRNRIHLHTKTFNEKTDAMCCPSIEGRTTFVVRDKQLREEDFEKSAHPRD
jgi:hypothetical protein